MSAHQAVEKDGGTDSLGRPRHPTITAWSPWFGWRRAEARSSSGVRSPSPLDGLLAFPTGRRSLLELLATNSACSNCCGSCHCQRRCCSGTSRYQDMATFSLCRAAMPFEHNRRHS
jgi:hypothetical protein